MTTEERDIAVAAIARVAAASPSHEAGKLMSVARRVYLTPTDDRAYRERMERREERMQRSWEEMDSEDAGQPMSGPL